MRVPAAYADKDVCIIGLGYVGLTLAVAMAEVGFRVHGVEKVEAIRRCVTEGRAHFKETGLDPRLAAQVSAGRLSVSDRLPTRGATSVFIVTVGTPLADGKRTNLDAIRSVAADLAGTLAGGELVVLRSTVRVGVSREIVKAELEQSRLPFDLAFCPERTLEGRAMQELRSLPQIVGGLNEHSTLRASQLFSFLTPTTIKVGSLEAAEMVKLINNTQRDLMFAFANEVALMCDAVGVSAAEVIEAGNVGYPRASMPMPGPGGGPCLEKDPYILAEGVAARGGEVRLALLGRRLNEELPMRAASFVEEALALLGRKLAGSKVAVIGVAFKGQPETSDLRGTLAGPLIAAVRERGPGSEVVAWDPAVEAAEVETLGAHAADSIESAFRGAQAVIFQNNNRRFADLDLEGLSHLLAPDALIYDLWNQFSADSLKLRSDVRYCGLGTQLELRRLRVADAKPHAA